MKDRLSFSITLGYAVLLAIGGLIGFLSKASTASLYAGLVSAGCMLAGSLLITKQPRAGRRVSFVFVCAITLLFVYRAVATFKLIPMVMTAVGICVALILFFRRKVL